MGVMNGQLGSLPIMMNVMGLPLILCEMIDAHEVATTLISFLCLFSKCLLL